MAALEFQLLLLLLLLLMDLSGFWLSFSTITHLPDFEGRLPFELETGYIGVGDSESVRLFYYFVKSETDSRTDPLILWHSGGPGCSALSALLLQIGPLKIKVEKHNGELPELELNPYSWTKVSNIIFLDSPVGTGLSYATIHDALETGDRTQAHHSYLFLQKWLIEHPEFRFNPFRATLISDELFESSTRSCGGEYEKIDPRNMECLKYYDTYVKCISGINSANILLPQCPSTSPKAHDIPTDDCYEYIYLLLSYWANNPEVRKTLHIHEGSVGKWIRCIDMKNYKYDIHSVVPYHNKLNSEGYRSLIYRYHMI